MKLQLWKKCLDELQDELSGKQYNTWIRPIQPEMQENELLLLVPNRFVLDHVKQNFFAQIKKIIQQHCENPPTITLCVGSCSREKKEDQGGEFGNDSVSGEGSIAKSGKTRGVAPKNSKDVVSLKFENFLNKAFIFESFVEGKSNQLARAAACQVASNAGKAYNPLYIYGGVGLGKTHLMHAIGNTIVQKNSSAKVLYLHSERFVADMVKALQRNTMNDFKKLYRSLDALLIDDIQFFSGKERSQEEFFHTFNSLFDNEQQIVLTSDRYPKEISGVEERLKSRFGWGLTVAIEPPELETRVAILMKKAELSRIELPSEVAFFIAKHIQSNVRELEGALKRVIASAHFTGRSITLDFTKETLKDLLALQARMVTIDNIQKTVAEYFKIKVSELLSQKRNRILARPRQIAMTLAKELTNHSLPEIAEAFGGRDHTTVIHANKKIKDLLAENTSIAEDYRNLLRILTT